MMRRFFVGAVYQHCQISQLGLWARMLFTGRETVVLYRLPGGFMERHMIKRVVCLCVLLVGVIAQVQAEQGCPYPSSIQFVQGHFQSVDGKGSWRSPKVDHQDFVDVFIGAVFMPGKGQERENGYLEKCIYRTGNGDVMALRLDVPKAVGSMSLTNTLFWQLASDPFGLVVYICQDSQPDNCSFTTKRTQR